MDPRSASRRPHRAKPPGAIRRLRNHRRNKRTALPPRAGLAREQVVRGTRLHARTPLERLWGARDRNAAFNALPTIATRYDIEISLTRCFGKTGDTFVPRHCVMLHRRSVEVHRRRRTFVCRGSDLSTARN